MKTIKKTLLLALVAAAAWAADAKISGLSLGDPAQPADEVPINRGGNNFRLTVEAINGEHCEKALVAATPTAVVEVTVASGAATGGRLGYTVVASDGTDHQARHGSVHFSAVNKAGTETCSVFGAAAGDADPDQTEDASGTGSMSSGTLTYSWSAAAGTNTCVFSLSAASSLTENVLSVLAHVELIGGGTPTCQ